MAAIAPSSSRPRTGTTGIGLNARLCDSWMRTPKIAFDQGSKNASCLPRSRMHPTNREGRIRFFACIGATRVRRLPAPDHLEAFGGDGMAGDISADPIARPCAGAAPCRLLEALEHAGKVVAGNAVRVENAERKGVRLALEIT